MTKIGPAWEDVWVDGSWKPAAWGGLNEVSGDISVAFIADSEFRVRRRRRRRCKNRKRCHVILRDSEGNFLSHSDEKRFVELTNRMRNKFNEFVPKPYRPKRRKKAA